MARAILCLCPSRMLIGLLLALCSIHTTGAIFQLPRSIEADSDVLFISPNKAELYECKEFIDSNQGSYRLNVLNATGPGHRELAYFRFSKGDQKNGDTNNELIVFDQDDQECHREKTDTWLLKELSSRMRIFRTYTSLSHLPLKDTEARLALGPIGLLKIIYSWPELFDLDSIGFDSVNLVDMYYFSSKFWVSETSGFRVVAVLPLKQVELELGRSRLSDIKANSHLAKLAIIHSTSADGAELMRQMNSSEFFDGSGNGHNLDKLIISYRLIRERELGKHLGQLENCNTKDARMNPFSLPTGSGCGDAILGDSTSLQGLGLQAAQFSGRFEALDFADEYFIAYDHDSKHLRYDSLGELKMIYSLRDKLTTAIPLASAVQASSELEQSHCAQTSGFSRNHNTESRLANITRLSDVLGIGPETKDLAYLGTTILDDNILHQVYEREVSYEDVPLLLTFHSRLKIQKNSRLILVFYFVDDSTPPNSRLMTLRRLELLSKNRPAKYKFRNAQLTFSSFSWSLEAFGDSESEQIEHPVQIFDTIECHSRASQLRLDVRLWQNLASSWRPLTDQVPSGEDPAALESIREQMMSRALGAFEESLMAFVIREARLARSQVNQLELDIGEEQLDRLIVRAVLTHPLNFNHHYQLIGWIQDASSFLPVGKKPLGRMVKGQLNMPLHQCALRIAQVEANKRQPFVLMTFCPNLGCAQLDDQHLNELDYLRANGSNVAPDSGIYFNMCFIYLLKRDFVPPSHAQLNAPDYIEASLRGKPVVFFTEPVEFFASRSEENQANKFDAYTYSVSVSNNLNHEDWDEKILEQNCYTRDTRLVLVDQEELPNLQAEIVAKNEKLELLELELDKHHSRLHCHQACTLTPSCLTYSFNSLTHLCVLSNIEQTDLSNPSITLERLQGGGKHCRVYALNHALLYEHYLPSTGPLAVRPADLLNKGRPLLVANVGECARLCHQVEFGHLTSELNQQKFTLDSEGETGEKNRCESFMMLRHRALCLLAGTHKSLRYLNSPKSSLKNDQYAISKTFSKKPGNGSSPQSRLILIERIEQLEGLIRKEVAWEEQLVESFEKNYRSLFTCSQATSIHFRVLERRAHGQLERIVPDIDCYDCARECAVVDSDCVAFDFHCDLDQRCRCKLLYLRGPETLPASLLSHSAEDGFKLPLEIANKRDSVLLGSPLNDLEAKLYSPQLNNPFKVLESGDNEQVLHCALRGDEIYLKRLIARNKMGAKDEGGFLSQKAVDDSSPNPLWFLILAFASFSSGFVLFLRLAPRFRNSNNSSLSNEHRDSIAQLELNEMVDI